MIDAHIVHISTTPIAGAPLITSGLLARHGYKSRCIAPGRNPDGRDFGLDVHPTQTELRDELLSQADIIVAHNGGPASQKWFRRIIRHKRFCVIYHSQPGRVDRTLEWLGAPVAVLGQYQPRLYGGQYPLVAGLIPLDEPDYQPATRNQPKVRIAYAPSQLSACFDRKASAFWDNKGYQVTVTILARLAKRADVEVDVITGCTLKECLRRKRQAHIVIDECVTGSYHRSSLEGLALGAVVVNAADRLSLDAAKHCSGGAASPFVISRLDGLLCKLTELAEAGPAELIRRGLNNRRWMQQCWLPAELISRGYEPLLDSARRISAV